MYYVFFKMRYYNFVLLALLFQLLFIKEGIPIGGRPLHNASRNRLRQIEKKNFAEYTLRAKAIELTTKIIASSIKGNIKKLETELKKLKNKCIDVKRVRRMAPPLEIANSSKENQVPTHTYNNVSKDKSKHPEIRNLTNSIVKLKTMREKEKLLQGMKNRRAENEADKLNVRIHELKLKIAESKESCEPRKRVKRRSRRRRRRNKGWGKRQHEYLNRRGRLTNYEAHLTKLKKKHNAYRQGLRTKAGKIREKIAKLKKKCIVIDSRFKRSVPGNDGLIGNYTREKSDIAKTLAKLKETRKFENKKQVEKEIADAGRIQSLQGVVATLEEELKATNLRCGPQKPETSSGDVYATKFKRNALPNKKTTVKNDKNQVKNTTEPTKSNTKKANNATNKLSKNNKESDNKNVLKSTEKKKYEKAKMPEAEQGKKKVEKETNKLQGKKENGDSKENGELKNKKKKGGKKNAASTKKLPKSQKKDKKRGQKKKDKKREQKKKTKKSELGKYPKDNWWTNVTNKMRAFWGAIAKKFKCVKEGRKCKYGYQMCCGSNLYCNPLLTKGSKTGICTACIPYGQSCMTHGSCCSKRCIKTKANGKCGPSYKDKKNAAKKRKAKRKKKEKEKKKIESALTKAAKKEEKKG